MTSLFERSLRVYPDPKLRSIEIGCGQNTTTVEIRANGNDLAVFNVALRKTASNHANYYVDEPPVFGQGVSSIQVRPLGSDLDPEGPLPEGSSSGGMIAGGSAATSFIGLPGNNATNAFATWDTKGVYGLRLEIGCTGSATNSQDFSDLTIMVSTT
jgi:hypothetical protein